MDTKDLYDTSIWMIMLMLLCVMANLIVLWFSLKTESKSMLYALTAGFN
jgi:hypothetical protein